MLPQIPAEPGHRALTWAYGRTWGTAQTFCTETVHRYCVVMATPSFNHLDATSVRALAHPLRSRLVAALRLAGPATATALAKELDTNSGATSYHLRRLEQAGLVEDTEQGDGRSRLWRATTTVTNAVASDFDEDEDAATALAWLSRDWLRHFTDKFARWLDVEHGWPARWRDTAGMSDAMVLVTADQLGDMTREIFEVVERYARAGAGSPDAHRIATYLACYPVDMERTPRR